MDFLSLFLTLLGWGKDRASKIRDQQNDAFRLCAEVAGECLRAINIIDLASTRLIGRFSALYPNDPNAYKTYLDNIMLLRSQSMQMYEQAESHKKSIEKASFNTDWDALLRKLNEWRVTASAIPPYVDGVVKQIEAIVSDEELRRLK